MRALKTGEWFRTNEWFMGVFAGRALIDKGLRGVLNFAHLSFTGIRCTEPIKLLSGVGWIPFYCVFHDNVDYSDILGHISFKVCFIHLKSVFLCDSDGETLVYQYHFYVHLHYLVCDENKFDRNLSRAQFLSYFIFSG